ncbi:hypothetical protein A0H81_10368 [Grifola frondosa]|uniref:Uncharacterized protein n=1 Tax=Grifola frondosa TaxID=5627 RepID=A0A1C7LY58_GRIFR|nr:hypothetical protein A0H81_10368 [Grifola frondosa]
MRQGRNHPHGRMKRNHAARIPGAHGSGGQPYPQRTTHPPPSVIASSSEHSTTVPAECTGSHPTNTLVVQARPASPGAHIASTVDDVLERATWAACSHYPYAPRRRTRTLHQNLGMQGSLRACCTAVDTTRLAYASYARRVNWHREFQPATPFMARSSFIPTKQPHREKT